MEDSDAKKFEELSDELQVAAMNLMNHLRTNHARIRIRDTIPELYITLSEGRHSSGSSRHEEADVPVAQDAALPSFFAKLRKVLLA